jgi:hypothetical protein
LPELIREGDGKTRDGGKAEDPGVNPPRAEAVDQHSNADARWNRQRQIAQQQNL